MARTRNRRIYNKKASVVSSFRYLVFALIFFLGGIAAHIFFESKCNSLQKEVGRKKSIIESEEAVYERDLQKWEALKTPRKLSAALRRHGLDMKYPSPDRVVHMSKDGRPDRRSIALTRASARISRTENTASVSRRSSSRSRR